MTVLLSGCWVPESFDAKIVLNKDGSYTFSYDGILTYAMAAAAANKGELSLKDEAALKQGAADLARESGFKQVDYRGKGRFKVIVEEVVKSGQPYYFPKSPYVISIVPQKDGVLTVSAVRPNGDLLRKLQSIGLNIDGTLSVSVAKGLKVVKHNAQSEPLLFGGYKWKIKSLEDNPMIVVQPSS